MRSGHDGYRQARRTRTSAPDHRCVGSNPDRYITGGLRASNTSRSGRSDLAIAIPERPSARAFGECGRSSAGRHLAAGQVRYASGPQTVTFTLPVPTGPPIKHTLSRLIRQLYFVIVGLLVQVTADDRVVRPAALALEGSGLTAVEPAEARLSRVGWSTAIRGRVPGPGARHWPGHRGPRPGRPRLSAGSRTPPPSGPRHTGPG
jgi:hypothetical protein